MRARWREMWRNLSPQERWRLWGRPAVIVIALAAALLTYAYNSFAAVEEDTLDTRFRIRGNDQPPQDLIVVAIDSHSLTEMDTGFPFSRRIHARIINRLRKAGAAQISYDIQFSERFLPQFSRKRNNRDNAALLRAIDRTPHVVLASSETNRQGRTDVLGGDRILRLIGARAGFSGFRFGARNVPRYIPRIDQNLDTFAVATIESLEQRQVDPEDEPTRNPWIDYIGPPKTFRTVPFVDVLRGDFAPDTFRGATVIIGATANNLQDVHESPFRGVQMSGPEIQANAIHTIQRSWPLRSIPRGFEIALVILMALVPVGLNRRVGPVSAFVIALAIGGGYLAASQLAFNAGKVLPIIYPMLGLATSSVGNLGLAYITTAFDRQRTKDTFSRFVPPSVVGEVLDRADGVRLGGEKTEATVLFSDIRGFTTFSESRSPEEVIEILNEYLTVMTDAILDHGGTLVSYIGDGIMAVFGAPLPQTDHADRALRAAKEMLGPKLTAFNRYAVEELEVDVGFAMGVGLNTGPVMSGMVGSERRLDYTIISDTVNTASRLEGATKAIEGSLLVADSTREAMREADGELELVGEIEIRGREQDLVAWTIPGL